MKDKTSVVMTTLYLFILFPFLLNQEAFSQKLANLRNKPLLTDTAEINEVNRKINLLWHTAPDSLIIVGNYTLQSSEAIHYYQGQANSLQIIGVGYYEKGENQQALTYYGKALAIAEKLQDPKIKNQILSRKAMPLNALGMYNFALQDLLEALKISKNTGYKNNLVQILNTLGMVYQAQGNHDKALQYYREGKDYMESIGDSTITAILYANIGNLLASRGDYQESEKVYRRALSLSEHFKNPKTTAYALKSLGTLYLTMREYPKALNYFLRAKDILQKIGEKAEYLSLLDYLTDNHLALGNKQLALNYANATLTLAQHQGQLYYIGTSANSLSKIYESLGNFNKSLKFERISRKATDSLSKSNVKEDMVRLEEQFKYEQKQQELENEHNHQSRRQQALTIIFSVIAISGIIIAFLIYRGLRRQRIHNNVLIKTKQLIEKKNMQLEAEDQFKEYMISVLAHDVRSPIAGLKSFIDHFDGKINSIDDVQILMDAARTEVGALKNFIDDILVWVHTQRQGYQLQKEKFDLVETLRHTFELYRLLAEQKQIVFSCELPKQLFVFGDPAITKIIIRNLLDNAIKYCHESDTIHIAIAPAMEKGKVQFSLVDSGPGLQDDLIQKIQNSGNTPYDRHQILGTGLGLNLCLHYAQLIGSTLNLIPLSGKGTGIALTLDLFHASEPEKELSEDRPVIIH